jgi:hypothetical protein
MHTDFECWDIATEQAAEGYAAVACENLSRAIGALRRIESAKDRASTSHEKNLCEVERCSLVRDIRRLAYRLGERLPTDLWPS